jgi:hypothetical protein
MAHAGAVIDVRRREIGMRGNRDIQQLHTCASTSTCTMVRQQARSICIIMGLEQGICGGLVVVEAICGGLTYLSDPS